MSARARKTGNWPRFAGAETYVEAEGELQLFWDRFRSSFGDHGVFQADVELKRCLPLLLHGDEGRGKKRQGVLILDVHSILGAGVATKRKRNRQREARVQSMNYKGHPLCTRLLLGILPKEFYEADNECYFSLVERLCEDFSEMITDGVLGEDGKRYTAAVLFCKGDLPFLHKVGRLWRSFYNAPKRESSARDCTGVCHLCDAGVAGVPYEDLSMEGGWTLTFGTTTPWTTYPELLQHCHHIRNFPATFFAFDPFHCFHLGEGRNLIANCMKMILPIAPGGNIDAKLDSLFADYKSYCRMNKCQAYASRFNGQLFRIVGNEFPTGSWTKGNFTTSLVKWMDHYLNSRVNSFQPDSLLAKAAARMSITVTFCLI